MSPASIPRDLRSLLTWLEQRSPTPLLRSVLAAIAFKQMLGAP
jgi:hypothetical protein